MRTLGIYILVLCLSGLHLTIVNAQTPSQLVLLKQKDTPIATTNANEDVIVLGAKMDCRFKEVFRLKIEVGDFKFLGLIRVESGSYYWIFEEYQATVGNKLYYFVSKDKAFVSQSIREEYLPNLFSIRDDSLVFRCFNSDGTKNDQISYASPMPIKAAFRNDIELEEYVIIDEYCICNSNRKLNLLK